VRGRLAVAAACFAAVPALSGCGGDRAASDDPAALVPPNSAFYAQVLARPSGDLAASSAETLRRVTGERDVGAAISAFIDEQLLEDSPGLSFEDDVEPWLGDRAAFFSEDLDRLRGAFVLDVADEGGAERFARRVSEGDSGTRVEIVDDFLVLGDERGVEDAIDASDGDSLADEDAFEQALEAAPEDSIADLYLSLDAVAKAAPSELEADSTAFFKSLLRDVEGEAVVANLVPRGDAVELEVSSDAFGDLDGSAAAELVGSLPGEAWAAAGVPEAGGLLRAVLRGVEATGRSSIGELEGALSLVGISVEDDLIGPIETLGAFIKSEGVEPIGAAAVISSRQRGRTRQAVETIGLLLRRIGDARPATVGGVRGFSLRVPEIGGEPIYVIPAEDRVVIGYGRSATERALAGGDPLSGVAEFGHAAEMLGADPIAYVAVPEALRVGEAFGYLRDPGIADAVPYLERARYVAVAVEGGDDRGAFKVLIGLQR
jgi:hypothetical protein